MQNLKIAAIQCTQEWEDKAANLRHFEALLSTMEPSDLVVFPEMFHTSFSMNALELAEEMNESIALTWLTKMSAQYDTAIYTSFICKENDCFYNRGVFMNRDGQYEIYDKRMLFSLAGEDKIFTAGSTTTIVQYKGWKISLQICYDLRFPEMVRNQITESQEEHPQAQYDLCIYVANWPAIRTSHWDALLKARAIENQCFTLGVNRVGLDGNNFEYSGHSQLNTALGEVENLVGNGKEQIIYYDLSMTELQAVRKKLQFLKDRLF